jgi:hypothetical protein
VQANLLNETYWPTNTLLKYNKIQLIKQFMVSINPTCFGTRVPTSGSLRTQRITSPRWSVGFGILCVRRLHEDGSLVPKHVGVILCFMNCILLRVFIGQYNKHKKIHKMSNLKFMNESPYITVLVLYLWYVHGNQCSDAYFTSLSTKTEAEYCVILFFLLINFRK